MLSIFSFASASFLASSVIPVALLSCRVHHDHRQRNATLILELICRLLL